jgi:5-methylcytosine-specific restriction endonuclease McrA
MPYKDPTKSKKRLRAARAANKQWAIEYKGGKCESCGLVPEYLVVLEFHHKDMNEKEFNISKESSLCLDSFQKKVKDELDKCALLCANCHRIEHAKWNEAIQGFEND